MPFLEKLADIAVSGRHVGDMSATFPAKATGNQHNLLAIGSPSRVCVGGSRD
jgi:hypothetical protein